ncbi:MULTISPECIES: hypothetical protein [Pseudoalteromonas]|uniref:Lipocalin-like domain-containing protein n=1 Tax=Pseudoalteromonas viridis TaxID=339617 RepID=A0ABX7V297_9GAMM|nr:MULTISPECIES: hypothetical protein [Pseudoalteromonas]QTL35001.1 hypothetical protein J5X90_15955 [Pseudoalteromonas viridis]
MSTRMYRVIIIILLLVCTSVGATKHVSSKHDFKSLMHGVWAEFYTEEGKILSYMSYLPEGRFHAFGYLEDDVRSYWFADGVWKMDGDQSCVVFKFDSFGAMPKDEILCVTVLSVTSDTLIYKDNIDNSVNTLKRVSTGFIQ